MRLRGNHHGPRPRGGTDGRSRHIGTLTVGLVGCASQKLRRPAPARELYASQLKASAYAETTCDRWYILSTKHGLVHPDAVLEPYDMKLGTLRGPPIKHWAAVLRSQLADEIAGIDDLQLIALCGGQYRTALEGSTWPYTTPMDEWASASNSAGSPPN